MAWIVEQLITAESYNLAGYISVVSTLVPLLKVNILDYHNFAQNRSHKSLQV